MPRFARRYHRARTSRLNRLIIVALVLAVSGALLVPAPASAAPAVPYCLRYDTAAGNCNMIGAFPSNAATVKPHGLMIIIAGGGWQSSLPASGWHPVIDKWKNRGWVVAMVEHSDGWGYQQQLPAPGGNYGFINVLQWFDYHRAAWDALPGYGPSFPICVAGGSSAGHFALMLAAARPAVDCVIAEGPPTKIDAPPGAGQVSPGLSPLAQLYANLAFGGPSGSTPPANIWSPQYQKYSLGQLLTVPILIGHAINDELVSYSQSQAFCPFKTNCWVDYLPAGTTDGSAGPVNTYDFTHANVDNAALDLYRSRERKFACDVSKANQGGTCT